MPEDASEEASSLAREARDRRLLVRLAALGAALIAALALLSVLVLRPRYRYPGRDPCIRCLRQIGLAIKQYAVDHNDAFPPSFTELYPDYLDNAKVFSCGSRRSKPSRWQDIQKTGKVTPASTSYVYVSGLRDTDKSACVLAYCRPGNHQGKGSNVLFLDTHVEWTLAESEMLEYRLDETRKLIEAQGRKIRLLYEKPPPPEEPRRWPYWLAGALAAGFGVLVWLRRRRRQGRGARAA